MLASCGERLLEILRGYWVKERPQGGWLFPGRKAEQPITRGAVAKALDAAAAKAKLRKKVNGEAYRKSHALSGQQRKAMRAIENLPDSGPGREGRRV